MDDLSEDALTILRHFKGRGIAQALYEVPAELEMLFADAERCEQAQGELASRGLIDLGPPRHFSDPSGVRSAALTRQGARVAERLA
jgi:hypothetical protein